MMLFTTPAANVTNKAEQKCLAQKEVSQIASISECRPKFEGKRLWSLQATSQLDLSTLESCVKHQDQLIANSNVASTMTLRTWCFCDSDKGQCPTDELAAQLAAAVRSCEIRPSGTECQKAQRAPNALIGPEAAPPAGRQNSTSIRLYPP